MRTVICGIGEVGRHLAQELTEQGHDVVVIDQSAEALANLESHADVLTLRGNASVPATLRAANAQNADLVIAVTDHDQANLVAALAAKQLGAAYSVARLGNRAYFPDHTGWDEDLLGVDLTLCPGLLAGCEVVRLSRADALGFVENFAGNLVQVAVIATAEGSRAAGRPAARLSLPTGCRTLAVIRDGQSHPADSIARLQPDDRVVVSGEASVLHRADSWFRVASNQRFHAVVAGGGAVGRSVAVELLPIMDSVTIAEVAAEVCDSLAENLEDVRIAHGDGTSIQFLTDLDVAHSDLFVAATHIDEINLMATLLSKQLGVRQAIALLDRPDYAAVYSALGIDFTVSPRLLVTREIVRFVQRKRGILQRGIPYDDSAILEVQVQPGSPIVGRRILDLDLPSGAVAAGLTRGRAVVSNPELTDLAVHDVLVFYAPARAIQGTRRALVGR